MTSPQNTRSPEDDEQSQYEILQVDSKAAALHGDFYGC
jgi:hypothetical protein